MAEKIFINVDSLKSKVQFISKMDGLTTTNMLGAIGVPHSVFANARTSYIDYCINKGLVKEEIKQLNCSYGYISGGHLDAIGKELNFSTREFLVSEADILAEIDAIKEKRNKCIAEDVKAVNDANNADFKALLDKLDEIIVAINKLGNIGMQNMESLNAIRQNLE